MITGAETAHLSQRPGTIFLEGRLPMVVAPLARELGLHDGQVINAYVIDPSIGGADTITTGDGDHLSVGGADGDSITTGTGSDIVVGKALKRLLIPVEQYALCLNARLAYQFFKNKS